MSILVDTNVLPRVRDQAHSHHADSVRVVSPSLRVAEPLCICAQTLIEFWSAATRPKSVNGLGETVQQARADVEDFLSFLAILPEPAHLATHWFGLICRFGVAGKQAHDARLVAFMELSGVSTFLTYNGADFKRYGSIRCITPSELLAGSAP